MKREWKRKLKKIKAKNPLLLFLLLTICTISIMTAGYALLKSELTLNGDANIGDGSSGGGSSGEVKDPEDMTAACVTDITYDIKNSWSNVYQVSLTITNNSDAAIHSWQIKLLNSKNVEIQAYTANVSQVDGYYYLSSMTYNSEVASGSSVTIDVQFTTDENIDDVLSSFVIVACGRAAEEDKVIIEDGNASLELGQLEVPLDATLTVDAVGDWGGIVNRYTLTITNNSENDISGWRGMLYFGDAVTNANNSSIDPCTVTKEDGYWTFTNHGGNGTIAQGGSLKLTIVLYTSDTTLVPNVVVAGLKNV